MMDVDALVSLRAVATYGTVARAATERGFTPSAVSQQVKRLERQVGARLLAPAGRGVVLTPAGRALVGAADDVLCALERGRTAAANAAGGEPEGVVRVAAFSTAVRGLLAPVLPALAARHPRLRVDVTELDPDPALDALALGAVDAAVVHDADGLPPEVPSGLEQEHLLTDVGDVVLRRDHPLAAGERLTATRLKGQAWVTSPPGTVCHRWFQRLVATHPGRPDVRHVVDDFSTQLALVEAGGAIALVPRLARPPLGPDLVARPVTPRPRREVTLVRRTSSARSPAVRALADALLRARGR